MKTNKALLIAGSALFSSASFTPSTSALAPVVATTALVGAFGVGDINADGVRDVMLDAGTSEKLLSLGSANKVDLDSSLKGNWRAGGTNGEIVGADINGDGFADALLGHVNRDTNLMTPEDRLYVIYGQASFGSSVTHNVQIDGKGSFGQVVATGDVNGDGIDDAIIGATEFGGEDNFRDGAAYVIYGGADFGAPFTGDVDADSAKLNALGALGFRVEGEADDNDSLLGGSVASGGDFNGDGFDDMVLGAASHYNDSSSTDSTVMVRKHGAAYVVFGSAVRDRGNLDAERDDTMLGSPHSADGDSEALGKDGFAISVRRFSTPSDGASP